MSIAQNGDFIVSTTFKNSDGLNRLEQTLKGGRFSHKVLNEIGENITSSAKMILEQSGHDKTGTLKNSIKYKLEGNSIVVTANAPYAAHIEYGFKHKTAYGGRLVGPFPYLRPALKLSEAQSKGLLTEYLSNTFYGKENLSSFKTYKKEHLHFQTKSNVNKKDFHRGVSKYTSHFNKGDK